MNRNLKIFLISGIPFGAVTGTVYAFLYDFRSGLISGLCAGLFFGLCVSFILGFLHGRAVKRIAHTESPETLGVHHIREVALQQPYDTAFALCIESLRMFKRCVIREESRPRGKIIARAGINWKTWSDIITFDVNEIAGGTTVRISSRPAARTTLVDFGKNLENVEKISRFLTGTNNT